MKYDVTVKAENGSIEEYHVSIERKAQPKDSYWLMVGAGTLIFVCGIFGLQGALIPASEPSILSALSEYCGWLSVLAVACYIPIMLVTKTKGRVVALFWIIGYCLVFLWIYDRVSTDLAAGFQSCCTILGLMSIFIDIILDELKTYA